MPDSKFILPDHVLSYEKITHKIVCESARRSVRWTWVRLSCVSNWGLMVFQPHWHACQPCLCILQPSKSGWIPLFQVQSSLVDVHGALWGRRGHSVPSAGACEALGSPPSQRSLI